MYPVQKSRFVNGQHARGTHRAHGSRANLALHQRYLAEESPFPLNSQADLSSRFSLEHLNLFRRSSLAAMAREAGMEEAFVPMRFQYRYTTDWNGVRGSVRNLLAPPYRNWLRLRSRVLLRASE